MKHTLWRNQHTLFLYTVRLFFLQLVIKIFQVPRIVQASDSIIKSL